MKTIYYTLSVEWMSTSCTPHWLLLLLKYFFERGSRATPVFWLTQCLKTSKEKIDTIMIKSISHHNTRNTSYDTITWKVTGVNESLMTSPAVLVDSVHVWNNQVKSHTSCTNWTSVALWIHQVLSWCLVTYITRLVVLWHQQFMFLNFDAFSSVPWELNSWTVQHWCISRRHSAFTEGKVLFDLRMICP